MKTSNPLRLHGNNVFYTCILAAFFFGHITGVILGVACYYTLVWITESDV